jgi:membrane protein
MAADQNSKKGFYHKKKQGIIAAAKRIILPGFDGIPLYDVCVFFFKSIMKGALTTRASSIAFNMFLAIFPAILFFFTLIAYMPIQNFHQEVLNLLSDIIPSNAYQAVKSTLVDILTSKRGGLMSFGFIAALYFSTNGINALIAAFNATYLSIDSRSWLAQRGISLILVLILSVLIMLAVILIIFSQAGMNYIVDAGWLKKDIIYYLIIAGKWIVVLALLFFAISFLYYLAPAKKTRWKFISAGSTLATVLTILISSGF